MKYKFEYVDFAKGFAISTIVVYHALQKVALPPVFARGIALGGTGVHLFFLLSGLGLMLSAFKGDALAFYLRRGLKIWYPYVLALTLIYGINLLVPLFSSGFRSWLAGVFLYQMFVDEHIEGFGGHFWFISTILQFYLVFPLLKYCLVGRKGALEDASGLEWQSVRRFVILSALLSVCWWFIVYGLGKEASRCWISFFLQYLWEFSLGMAIGLLIQKNALNRWFLMVQKYTWWSIVVALFGFGWMFLMADYFGKVGRLFNDVPALMAYSAFSYFIYSGSRQFFPPLKRFFLWVNQFSYALYLIHVLVLELFLYAIQAGFGWSISWQMMLVYFPLAGLAGWGFEKVSKVISPFRT